jgi:hypothetical protein
MKRGNGKSPMFSKEIINVSSCIARFGFNDWRVEAVVLCKVFTIEVPKKPKLGLVSSTHQHFIAQFKAFH